jgi:hypothetical protein
MIEHVQTTRRCVVVAMAALLVTGCTICPNPFDYSGPVPNGSAPQNDFRARSNGVIPIGMTPQPWPQIVERDVDEPMLAPEPVMTVSGESEVPVTE